MRLILLIVCTFYFAGNIFSQKNIELTINYSDSSSLSKKKKLFFTDSAGIYSYLEDIKKNHFTDGYISSSIDQVLIDSISANATIYKGVRLKWKKLQADSIESVFLKKNGLNLIRLNNKTFSQASLTKTIDKALELYERNGYPFTKIKLKNTSFNQDYISSQLDIDKSNLYTIDSINTSGEYKLSSAILYNLIDIHPDDIYNEFKIQQISRNLKNVPYIKLTKPVEVVYYENDVKIKLELENKKANQFNGIIGFVPNNEITNKLLLTGELKLLLYNQLSVGEKLNLNWQKIDEYSQKADFNINIPYFFNFPLGFDGMLDINKKDTSYLNVASNAAILFHISSNSSLNLFYKNKSSNVLSDNIQNVIDINTNLFGFGLDYQNLDYIFNPSKGFNININAGIGNKKSNSESQTNSTQIENIANIHYYTTISGNLVLKLRNQTSFLKLYKQTNYDFYENEAFRIGGLKTLRGFDEESIISTSFSIFTTELRYLFEENSAIYIFADGGYTEKNLTTGFTSDTPIGIGAGIDFETRAGIFTLVYALGKQLGNSFEVRSAKIHLGFISRF